TFAGWLRCDSLRRGGRIGERSCRRSCGRFQAGGFLRRRGSQRRTRRGAEWWCSCFSRREGRCGGRNLAAGLDSERVVACARAAGLPIARGNNGVITVLLESEIDTGVVLSAGIVILRQGVAR